jgi:hypothetical protein
LGKTAVAELIGGDHSFILWFANDPLIRALRAELEDRAAGLTGSTHAPGIQLDSIAPAGAKPNLTA